MFDICTVVFKEDIRSLQVQAESIHKYCKDIGIRNIYVVVNDDEYLLEQIFLSWWKDFTPNVFLIPRTMFSTAWVNNGWVSQQVFKLLTASISYNVYTLVLDAKTIITKELTKKILIDQDGRPRVGRTPLYPVFESSQKICEQTWNIKMHEQLGPGGVPFVLHNDTVRCMIAETTALTNVPFPLWFQSQGTLTEFMFYSAYVQARYGSLDALYSPESSIFPVNVCHSEFEIFDSKLEQMRHPNVTSVSVHRDTWARLSPEQKTAFQTHLLDRGLWQSYDLS